MRHPSAAHLVGLYDPEVSTPGPWPEERAPDVVEIEINEGVVVADQALADCVQVEANRLVFPASDAQAVMGAWPVGAPVIGGRASDPSVSNNVLGFARKVREVRIEGDEVIVETGPATLASASGPAMLQEIVTGTVDVNFDPLNAPELDIGDLDPTSVLPVDVGLVASISLSSISTCSPTASTTKAFRTSTRAGSPSLAWVRTSASAPATTKRSASWSQTSIAAAGPARSAPTVATA